MGKLAQLWTAILTISILGSAGISIMANNMDIRWISVMVLFLSSYLFGIGITVNDIVN